jgi:maltose O-acetyltransferase
MLSRLVSVYLSAKTQRKLRAFRDRCDIGSGFETGPNASCVNSGPRENIRIGANVTIHGHLETQGRGRIEIGDYTNIRYETYIGAVESIIIGRYVIMSHDIFIYDNNNHPLSPRLRQDLSQSRFEASLNAWTNAASAPIVIEDNVWIGFGAVILKGVRIGRGSIIGAQAVVTKDIPPFCVAAGNPAKPVKGIPNDLE